MTTQKTSSLTVKMMTILVKLSSRSEHIFRRWVSVDHFGSLTYNTLFCSLLGVTAGFLSLYMEPNFWQSLTSSGPSSNAGEQKILVKKVRPPSKIWTPPANPQPKHEEKEEEEEKKSKEEKPSPKPEAGKMTCSGDPGRLTSKSSPGMSISSGCSQRRKGSVSPGSLDSRGEKRAWALGSGILKQGGGRPYLVSHGVKGSEIQKR